MAAWSQVHYQTEVVVALNTNGSEGRGADVTVDADMHPAGSSLTVLYASDWPDERLRDGNAGETLAVERQPDGRASVRIDLPPAGMVILG